MSRQNVAILILSLVSFFSFVAVCVLSVSLVVQNNKYTMQLENVYQKNFYELVDNIESISLEMSKVVATNSSSKQEEILEGIYVACVSAGANLNALPIQNEKLTKVNNHINVVGGYSGSLVNRLKKGESLGSADFQNISDLFDESRQTLYDLNNFISSLNSDYSILDNVDFNYENESKFDAGFVNIENPSSKVPSLIFDGPFSDSVLNKEVKGLAGAEITKVHALEKMQVLLTYYEGYSIEYVGEGEGKIQTYNFYLKKGDMKLYVQLTKKGGQLLSIVSSTDEKSTAITKDNAKQLSKKILNEFGFENMYEVWSQATATDYYFNFAPVIDGVIYYPDLIKVKVDKSSGVVVGLEATNYAYNHVSRNAFVDGLGITEAQKLLNSELTVVERNYSIIPNKYVGESFAYEYVCTWKDYTYYVYLDSSTGEELNIMRVVHTENGDLLF